MEILQCENCDTVDIKEASDRVGYDLSVCPDCGYCHQCGGDNWKHYNECGTE